ncbi:calcium-binding protein, partial [Methylomonas koyamae]
TVKNWFSNASYRIEQIAFANGTVMTNVLVGTDGNDVLSTAGGNDYLLGGLGADTLTGGLGNDVYMLDNPGDVIIENAGEGNDSVISNMSYSLATNPNLENLTLTDTAAITATGNLLDNLLSGNSINNTLSGDAGNDVLKGQAGDDTLYGGSGNDTLYGADITDTAPATLINQLEISAKANLLNDGVGAKMDVYIDGVLKTSFSVTNTASYQSYTVDPALLGVSARRIDVAFSNDATVASPVQDRNLYIGSITVNSQTITSSANGVILDIGAGTAAFDGKNLIAGQAVLPWNAALRFNLEGNDLLDGGVGADTMRGGLGNDLYLVDDAGDVIIESADGGIDRVQVGFSYDLNHAANVENLTLTGSLAANATGNSLDNTLIGNSGNNRIDGGLGVDRMEGGLGDDTFIVDTVGEVVVEAAGGGSDTVETSISLTLGSNVEYLTLTGTAGINGTGNTLDNRLTGNSAANSLSGLAGNDTLDGQGGADTLTGGTGNDTYVLGRGYGADTVVENDATVGNADVAQFLTGVSADQLWFVHAGNNLEVSIIGTSDKLVVQNWYIGSANHVEQFKTTDGNLTLLDSQVESLVSAMAAFAPPSSGQITLPTNYQTALAPVIAANWQ